MADQIPSFNSEREEAEWWYDHRSKVEEELRKVMAKKSGQVIQPRVRPADRYSSKSTKVRKGPGK